MHTSSLGLQIPTTMWKQTFCTKTLGQFQALPVQERKLKKLPSPSNSQLLCSVERTQRGDFRTKTDRNTHSTSEGSGEEVMLHVIITAERVFSHKLTTVTPCYSQPFPFPHPPSDKWRSEKTIIHSMFTDFKV